MTDNLKPKHASACYDCGRNEYLHPCIKCGNLACPLHRVPNKKLHDTHICMDCYDLKELSAEKEKPVSMLGDMFNEFPEMRFVTNWNGKLDSKKYFVCVKLYDDRIHSVGQKFKVREVKQDKAGNVIEDLRVPFIAMIDNMRKFAINELPDQIAALDSGYSKNEAVNILRKMYKNIDQRPLVSLLMKKV